MGIYTGRCLRAWAWSCCRATWRGGSPVPRRAVQQLCGVRKSDPGAASYLVASARLPSGMRTISLGLNVCALAVWWRKLPAALASGTVMALVLCNIESSGEALDPRISAWWCFEYHTTPWRLHLGALYLLHLMRSSPPLS